MDAAHARIAHERPRWASTAFLIEALVLMAALAACLAVFAQLLGSSAAAAQDGQRLQRAITVAQNAAEEFSADPAAVSQGKPVGEGIALNGADGYAVACDVVEQPEKAGPLYTAHVSVSDERGEAFSLDTSRYVRAVG